MEQKDEGLLKKLKWAFVNNLKRADDVEAQLGYPVIGRICKYPESVNFIKKPLMIETLNKSTKYRGCYDRFSEALLNMGERQVFALSGFNRKSGTSICTANLAAAFARRGKKVLVIDDNYASPIQHKLMDIRNQAGMTEVLVNQVIPSEVIVNVSDNIYILPPGKQRAEAEKADSMHVMPRLITVLKGIFDIILIDCPWIAERDKPLAFQRYCDGLILIAPSRETDRVKALKIVRCLEAENLPLIGICMTKMEID